MTSTPLHRTTPIHANIHPDTSQSASPIAKDGSDRQNARNERGL